MFNIPVCFPRNLSAAISEYEQPPIKYTRTTRAARPGWFVIPLVPGILKYTNTENQSTYFI